MTFLLRDRIWYFFPCQFTRIVYNITRDKNMRSWRNWQTRTVQVRVRRLMGVQVPLTAPYQDRLAAAACPGFRDVAQFGRALRSGRKGRRFKSCHPDQSVEWPIIGSLFSIHTKNSKLFCGKFQHCYCRVVLSGVNSPRRRGDFLRRTNDI